MKKWICVSILLIVLGLAAVFGALLATDFDLAALDTKKYDTVTYDITDAFAGITVKGNTARIELVPADEAAARVVCSEREREKYTVTVRENTLVVELVDERKWYEHIAFFSFGEKKVTVQLPRDTYEALHVENSTGDVTVAAGLGFEDVYVATSTGDVTLEAAVGGTARVTASTGDVSVKNTALGALYVTTDTGEIRLDTVTVAGLVELKVDTGDVLLRTLSCHSLYTTGDTGECELSNVLAQDSIFITRGTGDVSLDACDAASLFIVTDTGDVEGTLCSDKHFVAKSDTGDVEVPQYTTGGLCEITTDTGDIELRVLQ